MLANIATAFLISLGIALVLFLVVKGLYSRFSPQALHILVAVLVIAGSTVAGTVAISTGKTLRYVASLEQSGKQMTGQLDALQDEYGMDRYGISAADIADGYVDGAVSLAKGKLGKTRTLSFVVMGVLNLLLALFLFNAGSKFRPARSSSSGLDGPDDMDDIGSSSSFDDLDLD